MRHEKIFKRADGSKVKIDVNYYHDYNRSAWSFTVCLCAPKKRTWKNAVNTDAYMYRSLSHEDKLAYRARQKFEHVTKEEVLSVMLELWQNIKPTMKGIV